MKKRIMLVAVLGMIGLARLNVFATGFTSTGYSTGPSASCGDNCSTAEGALPIKGGTSGQVSCGSLISDPTLSCLATIPGGTVAE